MHVQYPFRNSVKLFGLVLSFLLSGSLCFSQTITIEPPFWYAGLSDTDLTLLVHSEDISDTKIQSKHSDLITEGDKLTKNYKLVILDKELLLEAGTIKFRIGDIRIKYEIIERENRLTPSVRPSTNMYRIFPDRFANGDQENDMVDGYYDTLDRNTTKARHGGDLRGIMNHVDYLTGLHFNALLLNPILENNQYRASYHGYAATNFYKVDARLGTLEEYQEMCSLMNEKGIGVLQDVVYNHIGSEHLWMTDIPDSNWFNWFDEFTPSNYRAVSFVDPHASVHDKRIFHDGWFVPTMPDLNQRDVNLANYLIQNTIWWIETVGLSGFRIDTYAYPDNEFMRSLNKAVKNVFPSCYIYGEIWERGEVTQAGFSPNNLQNFADQGLDGITDYNLYFSILKWMGEDEGWNTGLARLYYALATDGLYTKPEYLLTFVDNHDQDRFYGQIKQDFTKWKKAIAFILTTRGIPCVYYGTELLWTESGDHGLLRKDFPGGWVGDSLSKFSRDGRTSKENEAYDFMNTLLKLRADNPALFESTLTHFVPNDGVYVYFRSSNTQHQKLMVILSNKSSQSKLNMEQYGEMNLSEYSSVVDVFTNEEIDLSEIAVSNDNPVVILFTK